jgi:transposase
MEKKNRMMEAKMLWREGYKRKQIAEKLSISVRTVHTYLKNTPCDRKCPVRSSLLDPFLGYIQSQVDSNPTLNVVVFYETLQKLGYKGRISILRDKIASIRKKTLTQVVKRFETTPGLQAQVDWGDFGYIMHQGHRCKLSAFVMTLGYSRKSYVQFVLSMKQSVLHDCHKRAFEYFGGVTSEILYDNMKTAFVCSSEGIWYPNRNLLAMAHHFSYAPKRCMLYRPQTKGKVERFIEYLRDNFWPRVDEENMTLDSLNEQVMVWLSKIDELKISNINASRNELFAKEQSCLQPLSQMPYDARDVRIAMVHPDCHIRFEDNKYSVPPKYIGESLNLKIDYAVSQMEIFTFRNESIRIIDLLPKKLNLTKTHPDDECEIQKLWESQRMLRIKHPFNKTDQYKVQSYESVEIKHPSHYDIFYAEAV